jgi:surface protein
MFYNSNNLRTIFVGSGWSTAAVTNSNDMFRYCTRLVGGQGTFYNENYIDKTYAHIDGGPSNPGYFTAEGEEPWNGSEAYACYTSSNTTLTFYYDNQRSSRPGTIYDLNTSNHDPDWYKDGTYSNVTKVLFDASFAGARPTTTYSWFYRMLNLQSITGMSYLNTSEVTNMGFMFQSCNQLTSIDVSHFNTSQVFNMRAMFTSCSSLTSLDLSSFNTSQVIYMNGMFNGCSNLTSLDLSSFNTSKVTDMGYMFRHCYNLRTVYVGDGWSTAAVTESSDMFTNCYNLVGGKGTTYDANHIDKAYAHIDGGTSNPGYFTDGNGPRPYACYTPSNTTLTFYYDNLRSSRTGTTYDLNTGDNDTGWDEDGTKSYVTKVVFDPSFADARPTSTYDWFFAMSELESFTGMSNLNTSEVTNMDFMFCSSIKLTSLDLSSFNTSQVIGMYYMFYGCTNLQTIYVGSGWSTAAVTSSTNMFKNCNSLVGGQGTTWNSSNPMDKTYAHIDGGPSNPGYFTEKPAFLRGDVNGDGDVTIADVTVLISMVLKNNSTVADNPAADCNEDGSINIADVTVLIGRVLRGSW